MAQTCNIYHTWHELVTFTVHGTNLYSVECHMCTLEECNRTSFMCPQWYLLLTCSGTFLAIISEMIYIRHIKSLLAVHLHYTSVSTVICCNSHDKELQLVQCRLAMFQIYSSDTFWQLHRTWDIQTVWTCPDCK